MIILTVPGVTDKKWGSEHRHRLHSPATKMQDDYVGSVVIPERRFAYTPEDTGGGASGAPNYDATATLKLLRAAQKGNLEQMDNALGKRADVNAVLDNGSTILHEALYSEQPNQEQVVRRLLEAGANVRAITDEYHYTPLQIAILLNRRPNLSLVRMLLTALTNSTDIPDIRFVLDFEHASPSTNHEDVVEILTAALKAREAATERMLSAVETNDWNGVTEALKGGADISGAKGVTVLARAASAGEKEVVSLLLGSGGEEMQKNCRAIVDTLTAIMENQTS